MWDGMLTEYYAQAEIDYRARAILPAAERQPSPELATLLGDGQREMRRRRAASVWIGSHLVRLGERLRGAEPLGIRRPGI